MFSDFPVTAITPAGRKEYMDVLKPYIIREKDRGVIDEWMIWVNTPHRIDLDYIDELALELPGFVRLVFHDDHPLSRRMPQPPFFRHACEKGRLYVKFDDDICYVHDDAITNLLRFRLDNPHPLIVIANTVCNGICSYLHQRHGAQLFYIDGKYERIPPDFDNQVATNPRYAEYVHHSFIEDVINGDIQKYLFDSWKLEHYQRIAINCIAWIGDDFAEFGGNMDGHIDEEAWLCFIGAKRGERKNVICGTSLVSHFAFYKHRKPFCPGAEIDSRILEAYRLIARRCAMNCEISDKSIRNTLTMRPML